MKILFKVVPSVFFTLACQTAMAWQVVGGDFNVWLNQIKPKESVYIELEKYFVDDNISSQQVRDYTTAFMTKSHSLVYKNMLTAMKKSQSQQGCKPESNTTFLENFTGIKTGKKFEEHLLQIDTLECFSNVDVHKAFNTIMSKNFQLEYISELKNMQVDETTNRICQDTYVFPVGKSSYCFTLNIWSDGKSYVVHSYNELNRGNPSAPVYFREAVTVLMQLDNGKLAAYVGALGRGPKLPFHSIVVNTVESNQKKLLNALKVEAH